MSSQLGERRRAGRWCYGPDEGGPAFTRDLLEMFIRWSAELPRQNYQLAVIERTSAQELIGCAGVRCAGFDGGVAELGIELAPRCWGRGLATEAAGALVGFAFRDLGVQALVAISVTENGRVARVLSKLGFRPAGTRAGSDWMRARGWSETEWRLTAEAWRSTNPG